MRVYLCDKSACEFWRSGFIEDVSVLKRTRASALVHCARSAEVIRSIDTSWLPVGETVHILVPDASCRCVRSPFAFHVFSGKLPRNAFLAISDQVFMASPEFCFVQAAANLTLPRLIEFGDELCGVYSMRPNGEEGFFTRSKPLTTVAQLQRFVDVMPRVPGLAIARRALRFIVDGSASPAETKLEMFTSLPRLLGGGAFEQPAMNYELRLPPKAANMAKKRMYRCDLAWPDRNVAVEYNSMRYHTSNAQVTADDIRKNILEYCGMHVIVAKPYHLYDYRGFADFETQLAKALGVRLRPLTARQREARVQLRKELLQRDEDFGLA